MKLRNIFLISLLLIVLTVGAVSATSDFNETVGDDSLDDDGALTVGDDDDDDGYEEVEIDIPDEVEDFEDGTIDISLPDDAKGTLTLKINNTVKYLKFDGTDEDDYGLISIANSTSGKTSLNISGQTATDWVISLSTLKDGVYSIEVEYKDKTNSKYNTNETETVAVAVGGDIDEIEIDDVYIYHDEESIIAIPQSMVSGLTVLINNTKQEINSTGGEFFVDLSKLGLGSYDIVIYNSTGIICNTTFLVAGVILGPESMTYKSNESISIILPHDATGSLVITKNDVEIFNQKVVNGTASFSLSDISVGEYNFVAKYVGVDYEDDIEEFEEIIDITPIITYPSRMTAGEKKYLTIECGPEAQGDITIEADVYEYAIVRLDSNGNARVSLAGLDDGVIDVEVKFELINGLYFEESYEIDVKGVPARIAGSKNIKMTYGTNKIHKVTVYTTSGKFAEEGEYVEIKIGKKTFDTAVGKNGVVKFKIPKSIAPGKYKIKTVYENKAVQSKIVIKHLLKLKKAKVKSSAKKLVLKATLKKGMKNKKVIFKFNGKKIKAKTNKKGVAKAVVKNKILKKLKVGKKVTYSATYLKDTVKRTVKVKK